MFEVVLTKIIWLVAVYWVGHRDSSLWMTITWNILHQCHITFMVYPSRLTKNIEYMFSTCFHQIFMRKLHELWYIETFRHNILSNISLHVKFMMLLLGCCFPSEMSIKVKMWSKDICIFVFTTLTIFSSLNFKFHSKQLNEDIFQHLIIQHDLQLPLVQVQRYLHVLICSECIGCSTGKSSIYS